MRRTPSRALAVACSLVLATVLALPVAAVAQEPGPGEAPGSAQADDGAGSAEASPGLRRSGRWLVDPQGRVVRLQGIDLVHEAEPYCPPDDPGGFTASDADLIASEGFNAVRVGVLLAGLMPEEGRIDPAYLECIERVVGLLTDRDLWVLVSLHQDRYSERFGGAGFPEWAVHDGGLPLPDDPPATRLPDAYADPAINHAFDNLWLNRQGLWDRTAQAWHALVEALADRPRLAGYELLTEPWPGSQWQDCADEDGCPTFDQQALQPFWQHTIDTIRALDPERIVWFSPNALHGTGAPTHLGDEQPIEGGELGLAWRTGCPVEAHETDDRGAIARALDRAAADCAERYDRVFRRTNEDVKRLDAATLLTATGEGGDAEDLEAVLHRSERFLTPWISGSYRAWGSGSGSEGTELVDREGQIHEELADHLVRAYPRATAGMPRALSFDPTSGELSYRYEPRGADGPTEIVLPERHYPAGYDVSVRGATVTSEDGVQVLTLANEEGVEEVAVRVRPLDAPDDEGADRSTTQAAPAAAPAADDDADGEPSPAGSDHDQPALPQTGGGTAVALLGAALLLAASWRPPR